MFELKQKNEKELESALSDKRKKLKELDRALRDVDMDSNVLSVSNTRIYNTNTNKMYLLNKFELFL